MSATPGQQPLNYPWVARSWAVAAGFTAAGGGWDLTSVFAWRI